jgi:hypothetical protein
VTWNISKFSPEPKIPSLSTTVHTSITMADPACLRHVNGTQVVYERLRWFGSMLASGTQLRGFEPGRSRRSHVADLRHVKYPFNGVEFATVGKITGHFSPTVPPFPARGLSRRRRGSFQSRAGTSLHDCGASGGASHRGPIEEEGRICILTISHESQVRVSRW